MAVGGSDLTDWPELRKSAEGGTLKLVKVDAAGLKALTDACEKLVADIGGLLTGLEGLNLAGMSWEATTYGRTSRLTSMRLLFEEYHRKVHQELARALRNHQAIVTTMGETFEAAGKKYVSTEGANANSFETPTATDYSGEWPPLHHNYGSAWMTGVPDPGTGASGVTLDPSSKSLVATAVENGQALNNIDFHNVAKMFAANDGLTWGHGARLTRIAQLWHTSIQGFHTGVHAVFAAGQWQGKGAERAVGFLTKYLGAAKDLGSAMSTLGQLLNYSADFGSYVYSNMPHELSGPEDTTNLHHTRYWWNSGGSGDNKGYVPGVTQLAGMIPVFADPNTTSPASPPSPTNTGNNTPTDDEDENEKTGSGSGGGAGSGGGDKSTAGGGSGKTGSGGSGGGSGSGGGGSGSGGGSSGGGSGLGPGAGGGTGPAGGPATGPGGYDLGAAPGASGPGGGLGGGLGSQDMMSLFSEVLQLISSGLPLLEKLGHELATQFTPALQALVKSVSDGALTVRQAIDEASHRIGQDVQRLEESLLELGASGPVELSLSLFPGGADPEPVPVVPGRAGGHEPVVFRDFTDTRPSTEPVRTMPEPAPGLVRGPRSPQEGV